MVPVESSHKYCEGLPQKSLTKGSAALPPSTRTFQHGFPRDQVEVIFICCAAHFGSSHSLFNHFLRHARGAGFGRFVVSRFPVEDSRRFAARPPSVQWRRAQQPTTSDWEFEASFATEVVHPVSTTSDARGGLGEARVPVGKRGCSDLWGSWWASNVSVRDLDLAEPNVAVADWRWLLMGCLSLEAPN